MSCIFCKILNKEIPSYTIYEDDLLVVFLDINPKHNGHTLIVPKNHYKDLYDIDSYTLYKIMDRAKEICDLINEKLNPDGITLVQNNGIVQDIKHYHLHIIPKYKEEKPLTVEEVYNILK